MFENNQSQNSDEQDDELFSDPFADEPREHPIDGGNPIDDLDSPGHRLPWERLQPEDADALEQQSETPMCDHDEDRQVITKQSGGGIQIAGTGSNVTQTVTKVVCPTCGGEWDTWDGADQSETSDPFGF